MKCPYSRKLSCIYRKCPIENHGFMKMLKKWALGHDMKALNYESDGGSSVGLNKLERLAQISKLFIHEIMEKSVFLDETFRVLNYMGGARMTDLTCRAFRGGHYRWRKLRQKQWLEEDREVEKLLK